MGKKKSKSQKLAALAWCWYCDRTFEDQRVLLSHQKAKHFRCPMCPRRLNTAGGLGVHLDQVHKVGTDKIENALPGRESFDIEIYGMEGVPAADLAAWKKRQAEESGVPNPDDQPQRPKKPRYAQVALTPEEAKVQLAAHRALMGLVPVAAVANPETAIVAPAQVASVPVGASPYAVPPPPPAAAGAAPTPVPGLPGLPPPPPGFMPPPGFVPPAGMPFPPPGGLPFPIPPGMLPPPGFMPPPPGMPGAPPFPIPGMPQPHPPSSSLQSANGVPMPPPPAKPTREKVQPSTVTLKPGTVLVYGDNDVSPEEKRARLSQYSLANEPLLAAAPSTAGPGSATGPASSDAVGSYASVAVEGAGASVVTGEGGNEVQDDDGEGKAKGGGDPKTAEVETSGTGTSLAAAQEQQQEQQQQGARKRARAADLMG
ncbi:hypothetical protein JCM10212_001492 [Sporobolomyces blumeae]